MYDRTTVRPYDRRTVQDATFNMHGQLCRGHANTTVLFSSPVVSALGSESDAPGQGVEPLRRAGKKMRAPLLSWANLIYYTCLRKSVVVFLF